MSLFTSDTVPPRPFRYTHLIKMNQDKENYVIPPSIQGSDIVTFRQFLKRDNNGLISLVPLGTPMKDDILQYLTELLTYFHEVRQRDGGEKRRLVIVVLRHEDINYILKLLREELSELTYGLLAVPLASRIHLCINQKVNPEHGDGYYKTVNKRCSEMNKEGAGIPPCGFYLEDKKIAGKTLLTAAAALGDNIMDIESLKAFGNQENVCPYYGGRAIANDHADIIVTPYNYIKNEPKGIRDYYTNIFRGSILFFIRCQSEYELGLGIGTNDSSTFDQEDRLQEKLEGFEKLKPYRTILTTDFPFTILPHVRSFLARLNYEVVLPAHRIY